ncbi:Flagellar type III secretion system pore protein FliP [Planctomycetales bacterium 10988]|nr:Flagellar type III secretion system pore protein FliP [Planctomycetales bacterium 10988]
MANSLQTVGLLTALSLAPALLLMTTCYVRVIIVLTLLRQAIGAPQLPPTQVLTSLSLFITMAIMTPVWTEAYEKGIRPYTQEEISTEEAWQRTITPIKHFMIRQIEKSGNTDDIWLFLQHTSPNQADTTYGEIPLSALLPAFMISELKTAFLIGFQIYLPFLIIEFVVSSVLVSLGMLMLPPTTISLPLKILLFVLVDGWHLVIGMLMESCLI